MQEAKYEIESSRDQSVIPADAGPELESDGGDFVLDPFGFDAAWFARVDFDNVGLGEGCKSLVVWLSVIGIYPHGPVGAGGQRVHVHGYVDVSGVAPEIRPYAICVALWLGGSESCVGGVDAGKDAIQVCEKSIL